MGPIKTVQERCRKCYACIRNCPVKAIRVGADGTDVLHERCIGCGNCLAACAQQAKVISDCIRETECLLAGETPVVAVLGCSFPAFFNDIRPGQLAAGLKKIGFVEVHEGTGGVDLIRPAYVKALSASGEPPLISTHCPSVVDLVERHYPQLLKNLLPVVSPMIAIGRFIKSNFPAEVKVIYISSCIAGKFEMDAEAVSGAIDTVLTYQELSSMLQRRKIEPGRLDTIPFDGLEPRYGRPFPVAGGSLQALGIAQDPLSMEVISADGEDATLELIRDLAADRIRPQLVDLSFCRGGCIGGPGRNNRLTTFAKRALIADYAADGSVSHNPTSIYRPPEEDFDSGRSFANKSIPLQQPGSDAIKRILLATQKSSAADELNCGACGYSSCRAHAVAVYRGLAEAAMCLPHAVSSLKADRSRLAQKFELAQRMLEQELGDSTIVGEDPRTREVTNLIRQVGPTPTTVLIRGESGTGKELTARAIHAHSLRADKTLVTVNCTTLTDSLLESELFGHRKGAFTGATADKKGLFEAASGGTIFLDEIGDITPKLQAELLRVLDSGEIRRVGDNSPIQVDVRLIAATNKSLEEGVRQSWFREDLFYRLNVFSIHIPPLRSRSESLPQLIEHFLARASRRLNKPLAGVSDSARRAMSCYPWPGNIRELQNVIERAAVLSPDNIIHLENLPVVFAQLSEQQLHGQESPGFRDQLSRQVGQVESSLLREYLRQSGGNVSAAARDAGIPRRSFYRMLQRHGLSGQDFHRGD